MARPTSARAATAAGFAGSAPPEAFFVGSAVFHYLGPAFAVLLFARVDVLGVAWLRIASAAAIFALWRRPWRGVPTLDRPAVFLLLALGAVLGVMNSVFYLAIDRLPLGTVAAIEFVGPIVLAVVGTRSRRNGLALTLAVPGVYLLTGLQLAGEPIGIALAFANAALFMLYVILGHRLAQRGALGGIDGLAAAMVVALVVATPIGGWAAASAFGEPVLLVAGIGVGLTSSVIPYVCDQLAMARISRSTYSLLLALLPATATVVGILVLAQIPTAVECAGVGLVILGVAIHRDRDVGDTLGREAPA
jgi:inner membrane transporter RhtA